MPRSYRSFSTSLPILLLVLALGTALAPPAVHAAPGDRSPDGVWREAQALAPSQIGAGSAGATSLPALLDHRVFDIDPGSLGAILQQVPAAALATPQGTGVLLSLPMRDGSYALFEIEERPVLSAEVSAAAPQIRSYLGQGVSDRTLTATFVTTPAGFYAFVRTPGGMVFIEPSEIGNTTRCILYTRADFSGLPAFDCGVPGQTTVDGSGELPGPDQGVTGPIELAAPSGATLSTYRLAVSATGEFTSFFDPGGGSTNTLSQIAASVAAVNAIYLPEVTIAFTVTCTNVFEDAGTDPFTDADNSSPSLGHNQTSQDANCGAYDIGHVFHRRPSGFSGLASGSVVCDDGNKARGYSSVPNPVPATMIWIVDQLCHEMGHQFSAAHTFNSDVTGCSGNRSAGSAYEPGSGSTIMAYAAGTRCDFDFPGSNDAYFHGHSFDQITNYRDGGGNCATTNATGNTPPGVDAGADYTIPQGTPFRLTAVGSDADNDALTYCWEQFDLGDPGDAATNVNGPLFRSRPPDTSPIRVLPVMGDILAGNPTPTEILPLVDRTLNFRCTVRDNRASGGGIDNDAMVVTVAGDPFFVTSPNGGETLNADCLTTITWTVGGGSVAPTVDILLSTDGGSTFPVVLASATDNDGSHEVRLPCTTSAQARIMIQAVDNIFFDVSDDDFTITNETPVVAVEATGGSVGATCSFTVPYSAVITDDCRVDASSIDVTATSLDGLATVGTPTVNVNVLGPDEVEVSGTVLVSALTGCPADVRIQVEASDECGIEGSHFVDVEVIDDTPPEVAVELSETHLWPPSHKMWTITADVTVSDNCSGVTYVLASVTSNEPEDGLGDGDTGPDVMGADTGTNDTEFQLRAERAGNGSGRIYAVVYTASDPCGNSASDTATVRVNHSKNASVIAAAGFDASGLAFDPAATAIALIVPGTLGMDEHAEELRIGFDHPDAVETGLPEAPYAPPALAVMGGVIGNSDGVTRVLGIERFDADGDGTIDNLLVFDANAVRQIAAQSVEPVGLHFFARPEESYEILELFSPDLIVPLPDETLAQVNELASALVATLDDDDEARTSEDTRSGDGALAESGAAGTDPGAQVARTRLRGVQPNPFIGAATIGYELARAGRVRMVVYSPAGRTIRVIEDRFRPTGRFTRVWDGTDAQGRPMPPGIYIVHFAAPGFQATAKAVLMR